MPTDGDAGAKPLDDQRRSRMWRIAALAGVAGSVLAVATGLLGGGGRASLAVLLLVAATGAAAAALYGVVTALVDETRGHVVSGTRVITAISFFFGAAALMAMVAGVGG